MPNDGTKCKNPEGLTLSKNLAMALVLAVSFEAAFFAPSTAAQNNSDVANQYRLTLNPSAKITENLTGFALLGYANNPDNNSRTYTVRWPGMYYTVDKWLQIWWGLGTIYTDNEGLSANTLELRPFIGPKLFIPNKRQWIIFNYSRYEYRDTQDLDTHQWTVENRIRSRFGVEIPLTSTERAWKPKTWYALSDVEPFYRFDRDQVDPLRVRGGIGYVLNDRVQIEFIYTAQFSHSNSGLEYNQNEFRLNFRIGLSRGIIQRAFNLPSVKD